MPQDTEITNAPSPLVMDPVRFAELTGVTLDTIRGWINRDQIPTTKIGRRRMINLVLLEKELLQAEYS